MQTSDNLLEIHRAALIEQAATFCWSLDQRGRVVVASQSFIDRIAKGREVVGHPFNHLIDHDSARWHHELETVFRGQLVIKRVPARVLRVEGDGLFEVTIAPVLFDSSIVGATFIARDISAFERERTRWAAGEERLQAILEATQDAPFEWRVVSGECWFGPTAYALLGYPINSLPAGYQVWRTLLHPEDEAATMAVLAEHLAGQTESFEIEHRLRRADGTYAWVLGRGRVVERDSDGNPIRVVGSAVDITSRKQIEERLRHSEAQWRELLEALPVMVVATDTKGNIVFWNEEAERITGYSMVEVGTFRKGFDILYPDRDTRVQILNQRAARGRGFRGWETRLTTKSGEVRVVAWSDLRDRSPMEGLTACLIGVDITTERDAQALLREKEELIRTILTSIDEIVWSASPKEGKMLFISPAVERILGVSAEQLSHDFSMWERLVHPQDRATFAASVQQWEVSGSFSVEHRVIRPDGRILWVTNQGRVDKDENGSVRRIDGVCRDVTEQRALTTRVAEIDRIHNMGMLAAGVGHEINNPLTYLIGNLDVVTSKLGALLGEIEQGRADLGTVPGRIRSMLTSLSHVSDGAGRIRDIVRDLRAFGRPVDEARQPVDIAPILDRAIQMANNKLRHRATVRRRYSPVPSVMASEGRMAQVFLNLLINAADAIPEGNADDNGVDICLTQDVGPNGQRRVVVEIQDTGAGIAQENLAHVFDAFFTTKSVGEGSGLGLAISRQIVVDHGGDISVESALGMGSIFRVTLPAIDALPSGVVPRERFSLSKIERTRLLVVDDEALVGSTVVAMLSPDYDAMAVSDPRDVLHLLDSGERFDVMLIDIRMPEMPGTALYSKLIQIYPEAAEVCCFMSGGDISPQTEAFLKHNEVELLEKPFDENALRSFITRVCVRIRSRRQESEGF